MKTFLKEFFNSDECEYNHFKMPSREEDRAEKKSEAFREEIKKRLDPKDEELLDKYDDYCSTAHHENAYFAFVCGVRITLKVISEILAESSEKGF